MAQDLHWPGEKLQFSSPRSCIDEAGRVHSSSYISQLFNHGDFNVSTLNESFARVAHSASVYVRQNGAPGRFSVPAPEISQTYVTVYHIRWVWLTYLAIAILLVLSSLVPTTLILFKDRGRPEKDWKGSILPLLLYGLDDFKPSVKLAQQKKLKIEDIEELAKRQRVELTETDQGWKFA